MAKSERLGPVHPGEVLMKDFLKPMDLSQNRLALSIGAILIGSMKSCLVSEASQQIQRFVLRSSLAQAQMYGLVCRKIMSLTLP
jgi:hypothetical protein